MSTPEGIINMTDMETIFSVTDAFGIHRESVRVELVKEDPGMVNQDARGTLEITVPESEAIEAFAERLRVELEAMGHTLTPVAGGEDDDDEEEEDWLGG